jgi:hypothetical protein
MDQEHKQQDLLLVVQLFQDLQTGATEKWNGTGWTSVTSMNTAIQQPAGSGTQTSTIAAGGQPTRTISIRNI